MSIIPAIFGDNQPYSSQVSANIGVFNFSAPVTFKNLGSLVIVEVFDTEQQLFP